MKACRGREDIGSMIRTLSKSEPLNQAPRTKPVLGNDNKDIRVGI